MHQPQHPEVARRIALVPCHGWSWAEWSEHLPRVKWATASQVLSRAFWMPCSSIATVPTSSTASAHDKRGSSLISMARGQLCISAFLFDFISILFDFSDSISLIFAYISFIHSHLVAFHTATSPHDCITCLSHPEHMLNRIIKPEVAHASNRLSGNHTTNPSYYISDIDLWSVTIFGLIHLI